MQFKELKEPKKGAKIGGLGRGMDALIPKPEGNSALNAFTAFPGLGADNAHIYQLPLEKIHPLNGQPRRNFAEEALKKLADSIKQDGVIQPVVVRKKDNEYELIAGERRWRAAGIAGLKNIPAIIKELSDEDSFTIALVENIQRQDLTPLEEARAYEKLLKEYNLTQEQLAARVGKERSTIANTLRLLQLPAEIMPLVDGGAISAGHARAILSLSSPKSQKALAERVLDEHLSVRQAENIARLQKSKTPRSSTPAVKEAENRSVPNSRDLASRWQKALNCKVALKDKKGQGIIELHYGSYEELAALTEKICNNNM